MKIHSILLSCLLTASAINVSAQTARLYTPENGLPNTQVNQVCQDRSGVIWICTEGGLVRFDGMAFETFRHDRENPNAITSDSVNDLLEDSTGARWVATARGLDLFDADYNTFRRFDLQDARRPESNQYISRILEVPGRTAGSRIFVATGGNGIFVIDTGTRAPSRRPSPPGCRQGPRSPTRRGPRRGSSICSSCRSGPRGSRG